MVARASFGELFDIKARNYWGATMSRATPDYELADIRTRLGLRKVINVSGTMTSLGASIMVPEAIRAMVDIAPQFVEIDDLQRRASHVIAKACASQAGFVTASCSSGISLAIAGCMTRDRLLAIEKLPDAAGLKSQVLIQSGHMVSYGAPVEQAIALTGARAVAIGSVSMTAPYHLEQSISDSTAAALYVVSHHTVQYGMLPIETFAEICRARDVPVIVDAASEYDLTGFLAKGADIVIYSGHKFLGGPTSGIVAGRKDVVRAAYLQNRGIGRGMKVGKESIAGCMAALEAWAQRDHAGIRRRETSYLAEWRAALDGMPGIEPTIVPDPTDNPLDRLQVRVFPESGFTAMTLAAALAAGDPPIIVRGHEAARGHFFLDPCNLHSGEAEIVGRRLVEILRSNRSRFDNVPAPAMAANWPD
jgi:D-glucosaminate-6-phosphate ammonia-lyase